jgi:hypothetical protein
MLSGPTATLALLTSGRLLGYLARRPGNRAYTARCPRGRAGTQRVQAVDARRWRRQKRPEMTERQLSAADAGLRERITELSVHIPCGGLRGPVRPRGSWQSCPDEDAPQVWQGCDVSRERDLCIVCWRGTAGGTSRWSWLGCEDCRAVNDALARAWGFRPLALGRHSLMNGIGVRGDAPPDVQERQLARLAAFVSGDGRLRDWRRQEYGRLAADFDPLADIPLRVWQQQWPPSRRASADAFSRLLGRELPLRPPT